MSRFAGFPSPGEDFVLWLALTCFLSPRDKPTGSLNLRMLANPAAFFAKMAADESPSNEGGVAQGRAADERKLINFWAPRCKNGPSIHAPCE